MKRTRPEVEGGEVEAVQDRLRQWAAGRPAPPLKLFMMLTERCNLSCPSCNFADGIGIARAAEADEATLLQAVDEAAALGVREAYLVGGEIFVRRDTTLRLMESIKSHGLYGDTTTNGVLISDAMVERIVAMGWDNLTFSIDSPETETNDFLRSREGTLARIVRTILKFNEVKARYGVTAPRLTVNMVLSNRNVGQLARMAELVAELKIEVLIVQAMNPLSEEAPKLMLDAGRIGELRVEAERAAAVADRHGLVHNLRWLKDPRFLEGAGKLDEVIASDIQGVTHPFFRAGCFVPFTQVIVFPDGVVSTCWRHREISKQTVATHNLEDIWFGREFHKVRGGLLTTAVPSYCANCCMANVEDNRRFRMTGLMLSQSWADVITSCANVLAQDPASTRYVPEQLRSLYALQRVREADALALRLHEQRGGAPTAIRWQVLDELDRARRYGAAMACALMQLDAIERRQVENAVEATDGDDLRHFGGFLQHLARALADGLFAAEGGAAGADGEREAHEAVRVAAEALAARRGASFAGLLSRPLAILLTAAKAEAALDPLIDDVLMRGDAGEVAALFSLVRAHGYGGRFESRATCDAERSRALRGVGLATCAELLALHDEAAARALFMCCATAHAAATLTPGEVEAHAAHMTRLVHERRVPQAMAERFAKEAVEALVAAGHGEAALDFVASYGAETLTQREREVLFAKALHSAGGDDVALAAWRRAMGEPGKRAQKLLLADVMMQRGLLDGALQAPQGDTRVWMTRTLTAGHYLLARTLNEASTEAQVQAALTYGRALFSRYSRNAGAAGLVALCSYRAGDLAGAGAALAAFRATGPHEHDVRWLRHAFLLGRNARYFPVGIRVHALRAMGEEGAAIDLFIRHVTAGASWSDLVRLYETLGLRAMRELTSSAQAAIRTKETLTRLHEGLSNLSRALAGRGQKGAATEVRYWLTIHPTRGEHGAAFS